MSELVIAEKSDLVGIADEVRAIVGNTSGMSLDEIKSNLIDIKGNMKEVFHTVITPATSGEVIEIALSDKYELPIAVIARLSPSSDNDITGSARYPSFACYVVLEGDDVTSTDKAMKTFRQVNQYLNDNSTNTSDFSAAWYRNTKPSGSADYKAFSVYGSKNVEIKPFVRFYTTTGSDKKYGLMVGKTYDIWAIF